MNYNILTYAVYLAIMVFIIVYVGWLFYKNGRVFMLALFNGNEEQTDNLNKLLLLAYYLFNIGYTFVQLRNWTVVGNYEQMMSSLGHNIGLLIFILAVTHYVNIILINYLSKKQNIILH